MKLLFYHVKSAPILSKVHYARKHFDPSVLTVLAPEFRSTEFKALNFDRNSWWSFSRASKKHQKWLWRKNYKLIRFKPVEVHILPEFVFGWVSQLKTIQELRKKEVPRQLNHIEFSLTFFHNTVCVIPCNFSNWIL